MIPTKLAGNGKDFEELLLARAAAEEKRGRMTMARYGVQVSRTATGDMVAVPSLPDFDIALAGGKQAIIEAKVCSGPSFPLTKDKIAEYDAVTDGAVGHVEWQ